MEIKLSAGDKINIPENCKATIEDNQIIIEEQIEERKEEFKDGDILYAQPADIIVIFKSFEQTRSNTFCSYYNSDGLENTKWSTSCFKHATEEEKQKFFDELNKKGLRWNAEAKQMERIIERVKHGDSYLFIDKKCKVVEVYDNTDFIDDSNWEVGNYYHLSEIEQAEEDAKAIKAIYGKRLKI